MIHRRKKITNDLFHMTLVLVLLRLGPEILIDDDESFDRTLDASHMYLGSSLGYSRSNHHMFQRYGTYSNRLKTIDSVLNNFVPMREQLNYLSRDGSLRHNVIAYNPDITSPQSFHDEDHMPSVNVNTGHSDDESSRLSESTAVSGPSNSNASSTATVSNFSAFDLSPEDMDLIEILWKQDIDLGVSREAFSPHLETEIIKDPPKKVGEPNFDLSDFTNNELDGEDSISVKEKEGMGYTVDFETGEHILLDQTLDDAYACLPTEESLFAPGEFDNISDSFLPSYDDCPTYNVSKSSFDQKVDLEHDSDTDSLPDIDLLFGNSQKLENILKEANEDEIGNEMYPSMEEYWQDISTTLPLSVMSTYQGCVPYIPRPSQRCSSGDPDDYPGPSSSTDGLVRPTTNDVFTGTLLHNNSNFNPHASELNSSYGYLPPLIGPTSLGCAVASSIATLTNDIEPLPDVVSAMNATFGLELPGMLQPNQTVSTNERLLSELLMNEDLQLMEVANASSQTAACSPVTKVDPVELSSDSAASSNSGNTSLSDYNENGRTYYEELTSAEYNGNESFYSAFKYSPNHPPTSCYRQLEASSSHSDSNFNISMPFRNNYNNFVQHNHSYNLPATNGNSLPKPVTRDKRLSDEESANRDEKRAKALDLPLSISDIINLAIDEFNEKLSKFELSEPQLTLIRDIRRRGKNKVAAQNCRKRKMDQICSLQQDLDSLESERMHLETERTQLLHQRHVVRSKYSQLCEIVLQSTNSHVSIPDSFPLSVAMCSQTNISEHSSDIESPQRDKEMTFNQGVRAKRKVEKKRYDFN